MPTVKVAHLRKQGQDMIIAPMDSGFGTKTPTTKSQKSTHCRCCCQCRSARPYRSGLGFRRRLDVVYRTDTLAEHQSPVHLSEREPLDSLVSL
jgi:hypothetical protein